MKHIGVITEYNPFHNGHAYQLNRIKELYPDKKTIVLMSGNFVQRGEPAIFNKYLRAECALLSGADFVFELPVLFATASAEHFASAAVLSLAHTGIIDTICFGAETDNLELLYHIAILLSEEPDSYKILLQNNLKSGLSFPKARAQAVSEYYHNEQYQDIMKYPNNILGVEYLKAIFRYKLDLKPVIIKRIGNDYHDSNMDHPLSSATAIRTHLKKNDISSIESFIPNKVFNLLQKSLFVKPLFIEDFYPALQYALWSKKNNYGMFLDVASDFANQLLSIRQYPDTFDSLINLLSSRNYTNTRIQRSLLNIMLGHYQSDMEYAKKNNYISYLRLLGFHKDSSNILRDVRIPIINKVANANRILSPKQYTVFNKDLQTNQLYTQIFYNKYGISMPSEYEHSVIISE